MYIKINICITKIKGIPNLKYHFLVLCLKEHARHSSCRPAGYCNRKEHLFRNPILLFNCFIFIYTENRKCNHIYKNKVTSNINVYFHPFIPLLSCSAFIHYFCPRHLAISSSEVSHSTIICSVLNP